MSGLSSRKNIQLQSGIQERVGAGGSGEALTPGPVSSWPSPKPLGLQFKDEAEARSPRAGADKKDATEGAEKDTDGPPPKVAPLSGRAAGLANYEQTLGKTLGGPLHGAVRDAVSLNKVGGYADSIVASGMRAVAGQLGNLSGDVDEKAITAFGNALVASTKGYGSKLVKAEGRRMVSGMQGFVDANPEAIAGLTILAATGAVLADMDIPTLHQRFGITEELNFEVSARLGSIRNIALEKIEARLSYQAGNLKIDTSVSTGKDGFRASAALKFEF